MKLNNFKSNIVSLLVISMLLTGCGSVGFAHDATFNSNYEYTPEEFNNIFVSSAEVMYKGIDTSTQTIELLVLKSNEVLTLTFDGATQILDKYNQPMTWSQIQIGDIFNIAYSSGLEKLGAIVYPDNVFVKDNISKYSISENGQTMYIGDEAYNITPNVKVYSSGREISIDQLINHDVITIQGNDHYIYSIRVDNGHGYLELTNEDALVGGWIEIGQSVISMIAPGMLFTVPEGIYSVRLTNTGIDEYRDVIILRNEISTLDLGDIESKVPEKGIVTFNINPLTADVFVDGNAINPSMAVKMNTGIHEVTVAARGYATVSQYIDVNGVNQVVEIDLDKENATVSGNSISKNLYATLTIEAPTGVEIYEDNIYKGITPVTYKKTEGTHVLTFKKPGYITTSYTVYIENDGLDQTMSFRDLDKEGDTVSGNGVNSPSPSGSPGSTVSGNSISGNSLKPTTSPSILPSPSPTPGLYN